MGQALKPRLGWLTDLTTGALVKDTVAGLILSILLVPQAMAYAQLAGLPPQTGLFAALLPPLVYALFGTSNFVSMGPVALVSLVVAEAAGNAPVPPEAATVSRDGVSPRANASAKGSPPGSAAETARADGNRCLGSFSMQRSMTASTGRYTTLSRRVKMMSMSQDIPWRNRDPWPTMLISVSKVTIGLPCFLSPTGASQRTRPL